jgi:ribosomal protein S18 acetylase RimI-like enzyme
MEIRDATPDDIEGIQQVARDSLDASYGHLLDEAVIENAVENWYDEASLREDLSAGDAVFLVAEEDDRIAGFAQSYVLDNRESIGEIDWLHVSPDFRGQGLGTRLLRKCEELLVAHGVDRIEGRVLVANESGADFYAEHGFSKAGDRRVDIGGQQFDESVFITFPESTEGGQVLTESRPGPEGEVLYVAYDESARASRAPFYAVYADRDRGELWGWYCGNCESFDTAMDTMDRVECNECGNRRKAARWDAAYL